MYKRLDGYASTLYTLFATEDANRNYLVGDPTAFEQVQASIAYGSLLCGVVHKAGAGSAATYGQFASEATDAGTTLAYLHDPEACYEHFNNFFCSGWAGDCTIK